MHSNGKILSLSTSVLDLTKIYIHLVMRVFIIYRSLMSVKKFTGGAAKKQKKAKKRKKLEKDCEQKIKNTLKIKPHIFS